jgi:hypothetical protein
MRSDSRRLILHSQFLPCGERLIPVPDTTGTGYHANTPRRLFVPARGISPVKS